MAEETRKPEIFTKAIMDILACPVCLGRLCRVEAGLGCERCGRIYQVVEGIPELLRERGTSTPPAG